MSFSKAPVKRFNETGATAPPPGHYNLPENFSAVGTVKFGSGAERFKQAAESSVESKEFAAPSSSTKRKLNFSSIKAKSAEKDNRAACLSSTKKDKENLQREIRRLLQQCSEREHDLKNAREEVQRLQKKIAALTEEKLALAEKAKSTAVVEAELNETKASLRNYIELNEKKELQLADTEADLQEAQSKVLALEDANKTLETFNKELQRHDNDVTDQVSLLQEISDKLREDNGSLQHAFEQTQRLFCQVESAVRDKLINFVTIFVDECISKSELINATTLKCEERLEETNRKIENLASTLAERQQERNDLCDQNSILQEKISQLENERNHFIEKQKTLSIQNETQKKELETSNDAIQNLKQELSTAKEEIKTSLSSYKDQVEFLGAECLQLKQALESEENRKKELGHEAERLSEDNRELMLQVECAIREAEALKANLKQRELENASLTTECEELNGRLVATRSELTVQQKKLVKTCDELNQCMESLGESQKQCEATRSHYAALESSLQVANSKIEEHEANAETLLHSIHEMESQHEAKLDEFTRRILETQKKLNQRETELKASKGELAAALKKAEEVERLKVEKQSLEVDLSQVSAELQEIKMDPKKDENEELIKEVEKWKCAYEELQEKVEPFQMQLDAYAAEKAVMLNETNAVQAEVNHLGKKYAELLGHHNHKQKIKHLVKLKEENNSLKEENRKLRLQTTSLQKQVINYRKPRFDPSKAFQHHKENTNPNQEN